MTATLRHDVLAKLAPLFRAALDPQGGDESETRTALGTIVGLRAGSTELTDALRNELLAKLRAGEHVELDVDILAYEQAAGKSNRNFVRFRDGAMLALGRSGKGTPFLRNHEQSEVLARGGTVIASSATKLEGDAGYELRQTLRLTVPWAVEGVLRGTIDRFSIGFIPTGDILCTACGEPILTKCWHWPGDRLSATGEDGKLVRNRAGDIVVEWLFTSAELVETSAVNVPAVPAAQIEGIRAALSALSGSDALPINGDEESQEHTRTMNIALLAALAAIPALGLAATAGEDEVLTAVNGALTARDQLAAKLEVAETERKRLAEEVGKFRLAEAKTAEDEFITTARNEGRIAAADEKGWRKLFAINADEARKDMAERPKGCATPVGLARQIDKPEPPPGPQILSASHKQRIAEMGMTEAEYLAALATEGNGRPAPATKEV